MNLQEIFKNISQQLNLDFKNSKQINHNGNKGDYREGQLYKFLSEKLPKKYGLGTGEIISSCKEVSKQVDIVVYNQLESVPLFANSSSQVFPVESVFGVIEVKSELSKGKLIEALENIKSVKKLNLESHYKRQMDRNIFVTAKRSTPFGIIFAYSLSNNSLDSLRENLKEWESQNQKESFCNFIIILNEGVIYHSGNIDHTHCFTNDDICQYSFGISAIHFKEESLFHFYSALLDLCSSTFLGEFKLINYFDPYEKINDLIVRKHDKFIGTGLNEGKKFKLTDEFIDKVYKYCQTQSKMTQRELISLQTGGIEIMGVEGTKTMDYEQYLYNPENLPGLRDSAKQIKRENGGVFRTEKILIPSMNIEINGEIYTIPQCYLTENDTEEVEE